MKRNSTKGHGSVQNKGRIGTSSSKEDENRSKSDGPPKHGRQWTKNEIIVERILFLTLRGDSCIGCLVTSKAVLFERNVSIGDDIAPIFQTQC